MTKPWGADILALVQIGRLKYLAERRIATPNFVERHACFRSPLNPFASFLPGGDAGTLTRVRGVIFQSIFGIFAIVVAFLALYICVTEPFDTIVSKVLGIAISLAFVGVGVWHAWPLVLLIADWATGGSHLALYMEERNVQETARIASEVRVFASTAIVLAIANVPSALLLAYHLRKDQPGTIEPWLLLAVVLPVNGAVIAAKAQTWMGAALPFHPLLGSLNDSVSAAGIAAFLVLWSSIWLGTIGMRLIAALPMGPVAAFVTPVAALPYYYGYYRDYAWGWMALLFVVCVFLGFVVNAVRTVENEAAEEWRNQTAQRLTSRVLSLVQSGSLPDYVLFLRPFVGTGTLDTQSGGNSVEALDLETILARAVRPRWLIGLGSHLERSIVGAGRVYFGDGEWWDNVRVLARHASAIVVIPSAHDGTLQEIRWLHEERLLPKCVFVMPAMPSDGGWHVHVYGSSTVQIKNDTTADHAALWSAARVAIRDATGIELPPYSTSGALLGLDAEGRVVTSTRLDLGSALFKVRTLRRALAPLLPSAVPRVPASS